MNSSMGGNHDTVGREVIPMPVLIYGRSTCEDTAFVRERLNELQVSFVEIDIDTDLEAAAYVERVNHGERITPTIVFGNESFIVVEPDRNELSQALRRAGYEV